MANCCRKLTRVRALTGIFLVVGMRATLQAGTLAAALSLKGHALGSDGSGSALAIGFRNDFVAHGNLSGLVKPAIVPHSLGFFLRSRKQTLEIVVCFEQTGHRPSGYAILLNPLLYIIYIMRLSDGHQGDPISTV